MDVVASGLWAGKAEFFAFKIFKCPDFTGKITTRAWKVWVSVVGTVVHLGSTPSLHCQYQRSNLSRKRRLIQSISRYINPILVPNSVCMGNCKKEKNHAEISQLHPYISIPPPKKNRPKDPETSKTLTPLRAFPGTFKAVCRTKAGPWKKFHHLVPSAFCTYGFLMAKCS